jgi:hypothetical protein
MPASLLAETPPASSSSCVLGLRSQAPYTWKYHYCLFSSTEEENHMKEFHELELVLMRKT